jgi:plastocyanin
MICSRFFVLIAAISIVMITAGCNQPATPTTSTAPVTEKASTPIDPATAASVSGVVQFEGPAPPAQRIDMSADSECKGQNQAENVLVNDGRLANVLVYVKDGLGERSFPAPAQKVTIAQQGCRYLPHVAAAMVGQPVEFLDNDDTLHNIHPMPKNNKEWNQSQMPNGGPFARSFESAEIMIPVKCNQHPWMRMYLSVLSNPFFRVTGKDGSFKLEGLPPGSYTIAAVHEKYGERDIKVTVGPKDNKQGADFDFKP